METVEDKYLISKQKLLPLFDVITDLVDPNYSNSTIIIKDVPNFDGRTKNLKMKFSKGSLRNNSKLTKHKKIYSGQRRSRKKSQQTSPRLYYQEDDDKGDQSALGPIYEVLDEKRNSDHHINQNKQRRKLSKECKHYLKKQKTKLTRKYEELVISLMDRCEENIVEITDLQLELNKNSDKLKSLQASGFLLADENDKLKRHIINVSSFAEECKAMIAELEVRNSEMENKLCGFDLPCRDTEVNSICVNCSEKELVLKRMEVKNTALERNIQALNEIIDVLNDQLSKCKEKYNKNERFENSDQTNRFIIDHDKMSDAISRRLNTRDKETDMQPNEKCCQKEQFTAEKFSTLLNTYSETIKEKDMLIHDYEQQFESLNIKIKALLSDIVKKDEEIATKDNVILEQREKLKYLIAEKESKEFDFVKLQERTENAEKKLKEVYDSYEAKVSTLARDYEMVHREYYALKNSLVQAENRASSLETAMRNKTTRTVPADLHEGRVQEFNRLFEELKLQHSLELKANDDRLSRSEQCCRELERKIAVAEEKESNLKRLLDEAIKSAKTWRRAARSLRCNLRTRRHPVNTTPIKLRKTFKSNTREIFSLTLDQIQKIRSEIQNVKKTAYHELSRVEQRIIERERALYLLEQQHDLDMSRMRVLLEHKESVIANLVDKLADDKYLEQDSLSGESGLRARIPKGTAERNIPFKLKQVPGGYVQTKDNR